MSDENVSAAEPGAARWGWRHLWSVGGLLLLLSWFPFYAAISLVAPEWMVVPSLVVWFALLALAVRWFRSRPVNAFMVGVGAIVLWNVVILVGDAFGWTA